MVTKNGNQRGEMKRTCLSIDLKRVVSVRQRSSSTRVDPCLHSFNDSYHIAVYSCQNLLGIGNRF